MTLRKMFVNDSKKSQMVICSSLVNKDAIKRVNRDGEEYIIITSKTLPDNIVMNGILYPTEEIDRSYKSLHSTLAPVEHPKNAAGEYISAHDPYALTHYHVGAHNENPVREGGRVTVDKVINVKQANQSEKGKRLLDRINELETSKDPRPIHTSTGIFMEVEELSEEQESNGLKYKLIARNMVFDHDAILLDSVGAAQPNQGVGMAINKGKKLVVHEATIESDLVTDNDSEGMTHSQIRDALHSALQESPFTAGWVVDVVGTDKVVFSDEEGNYFKATFLMEGRKAKIVDVPIPVVRDVTYTPKTNQKGDAMKEKMLAALNAAGIETKDLDDDALFKAYNTLIANQSKGDGKGAGEDKTNEDLAEVVANALKPVTNELTSIKQKLAEKDDKELEDLAEIIVNSKKYPELDKDDAKKLGLEKLKKMAANCRSSFGLIGSQPTVNGQDDGYTLGKDYEMPK